QGTVGGHFRHCLEFVNCFLAGIAAGRVDYDSRQRNHLIETRREYARAEYARTIRALDEFSPPEAKNTILVKPEGLARDEDFWCASSIERELEFLRSHTIHHYALINFKLRALNFDVPPEFGVAPSTLRFWKQEKSAAGG
nr:hypothetical protein [Acidobacteriota bacterium]